jgi:hypothetical protein
MEALEMKTLKHLKIYLFGSLMMVSGSTFARENG